MGFIYKIRNKINGQCYIGQTKQQLYERWKQHKKSKSNCRYLKNAFKKYGIENFEFKMICICFDDDLNKFEIEYIKKYNSLVPNGYNLKTGGENGGKHSNETKIKISDTLKNRTNIERSKAQLGKPHTEDVKQKISNSLKGRIIKNETIEKIKKTSIKYVIYKYDMDTGNLLEKFNGYTDAAKSVGTTRGNIWNACNGKIKTFRGFIWKSKNI